MLVRSAQYNPLFVGLGDWGVRGKERKIWQLVGGWNRRWAQCLQGCTGGNWGYAWRDYRWLGDTVAGYPGVWSSWRSTWSSRHGGKVTLSTNIMMFGSLNNHQPVRNSPLHRKLEFHLCGRQDHGLTGTKTVIALVLYSKHGSFGTENYQCSRTGRCRYRKPNKNGKRQTMRDSCGLRRNVGRRGLTYFNRLKRSGNNTYRLPNGNGLCPPWDGDCITNSLQRTPSQKAIPTHSVKI
jgi:hypothetical protein